MLERLIIFFLIALLPLYNRVAVVDIGRTSKDNLFAILAIVLSAALVPKRTLPRWIHGAVLSISLIPLLNNENPASLIWMMQSFYYFSGLFLLLRLIESIDDELMEIVQVSMVFGSFIQSSFVIFEFLFFDPMPTAMGLFGAKSQYLADNHYGGTFGQNNLLNSYLALCSVFVIERSKSIFVFNSIAMIIAGSVMGPISLLIGLFYMFTKVTKKILIPIIAILMILAPFIGVYGHDSTRFEIWKGILGHYDLGHVLFGGGFGWLYDLGFKNRGTWIAQEHNEYLFLLNTFGITGIVCLLVFLVWFCSNDSRNKAVDAFILAFLVNSYGHFTLHQSTVAILFIFVTSYYFSQRFKYGMEWTLFNR